VFVMEDFIKQISKFKKMENLADVQAGLEMRKTFDNNKIVSNGYVKLNFYCILEERTRPSPLFQTGRHICKLG
jgi:hypothetical protein